MTVLPYIFYFILQLIILLILVNLSRRFLILVSKNNVNQKKYLFYFDVSVYLVWILFVMLKIAHALNDNLIVIGSVVLVLIILMWDYLKNLFLGIIFAFQYGYIKGVNLIINNIESKLESYYSSYFEILTNKGERVFRPEFGANLRALLWEGINDGSTSALEDRIRDNISTNFPSIEVKTIEFNNQPDLNTINFILDYVVRNIGVEDQINIALT